MRIRLPHLSLFAPLFALAVFLPISGYAQAVSIQPGVNESYEAPNVKTYVERFEKEGREVYDKRDQIVADLELTPGMAVADIGAGTGLFTRLMAKAVGTEGKVYAVDISKNFVEHISATSKEQGLTQVEAILGESDDPKLPVDALDLVYICDAYHHFEYPQKTLAAIHKALRPGGRLALMEFLRNSDWAREHVRADRDVFQKEIEEAGFELVKEFDGFTKNYFLIFKKK